MSAEKLDWIPLEVQRAIGSSIMNLPDFQFGWFWRGIIRLCDSPNPGYVQVVGEGSVELWKFFGAKSEQYFRTWGGNEFTGRYFPKTEDGTRRYNPRLLEILDKQYRKLKTKEKKLDEDLSFSLTGSKESKPEKTFHIPGFIPAEAWMDFELMRKKIRKPMTDRARQLIVNKLRNLEARGHSVELVLNRSIVNSWQDVFPLPPEEIRKIEIRKTGREILEEQLR